MTLFLGLGLFADPLIIYGHITMTDPEVKISRPDGQEVRNAMLNMPILLGDNIITPASGRCEIQFDNGTIFRLDKNSELKIGTVLSKSMTSNWKVTTLNLLKGQLYGIINTYNREMFQVTTPNAAVKMDAGSKNVVAYSETAGSRIDVISGKVYALYGAKEDALKEEKIGRDKSVRIGPDSKLLNDSTKDADFIFWNEGINRNFDEAHPSSVLPKPIYRYPASVIYWAEKWSSRYGEWVWDSILGYIWRPYADTFITNRPFFNANYVTIGGKLFMVPQEAWGWAPAYLGTWHWTAKSGWVWIPGDAFGLSGDNFGEYGMIDAESWMDYSFRYWGFNNLYEWLVLYYDWYYGYHTFNFNRNAAIPGPPHGGPAESKLMGEIPIKGYGGSGFTAGIKLKELPEPVRSIIKQLDRLSPEKRAELMPQPPNKFFSGPMIKGGEALTPPKPLRQETIRSGEQAQRQPYYPSMRPDTKPIAGIPARPVVGTPHVGFRNWNPDVRVARQLGIDFRYLSGRNEFAFPRLGVTSSTISSFQRQTLNASVHGFNNGGGGFAGGFFRRDDSSGSQSSATSSGTHRSSSSSSSSGGSEKIKN